MEFRVIKCKYVWRISNYGKSKLPLRSPNFKFNGWPSQSWHLNLYDSSRYATLSLDTTGTENVNATFELFFGNRIEVKNDQFIFSCDNNYSWRLNTMMSQVYAYAVEDTLEISCNISAMVKSSELVYNSADLFMENDFKKLYENSWFSDVTLQVGNREFKAHKSVLSARSEVFAAMFSHDTAEAQSNKVIITDASEEVMQEFLRYVYTNQVNNIKDVGKDLFMVADKYKVEHLNILCGEYLLSTLTLNNAAEILVFASEFPSSWLKTGTMDFWLEHMADLFNSDALEKLEVEHHNILIEVCRLHLAKLYKKE